MGVEKNSRLGRGQRPACRIVWTASREWRCRRRGLSCRSGKGEWRSTRTHTCTPNLLDTVRKRNVARGGTSLTSGGDGQVSQPPFEHPVGQPPCRPPLGGK